MASHPCPVLGRPQRPAKKKFFVRRKRVCKFTVEKIGYIDFKDVKLLAELRPRARQDPPAPHQRDVGLLPAQARARRSSAPGTSRSCRTSPTRSPGGRAAPRPAAPPERRCRSGAVVRGAFCPPRRGPRRRSGAGLAPARAAAPPAWPAAALGSCAARAVGLPACAAAALPSRSGAVGPPRRRHRAGSSPRRSAHWPSSRCPALGLVAGATRGPTPRGARPARRRP